MKALCLPERAACFAALKSLRSVQNSPENAWVVFNTESGIKYLEASTRIRRMTQSTSLTGKKGDAFCERF